MPDDERAVLLEEHGFLELRNDLLPAAQPVLAHAHHAQLCHCRFGQRRQHGGRHPGGGATAVGSAGFMHLHPVPLMGQGERQQPAHEAGAKDDDMLG